MLLHRPTRHFSRKHRPFGAVLGRAWPRLTARKPPQHPHDNQVLRDACSTKSLRLPLGHRCDEASTHAGVSERRSTAAGAEACGAQLRAAACTQKATKCEHGPVRRGVAQTYLRAPSRRATDAVDASTTPLPRRRTLTIDARVDDTVSTQARPARRAEARTGYTTTSKREDHPAVTQSGRGSRRGG